MENEILTIGGKCFKVGVLGLFGENGLFLRFLIGQFGAVLMMFACVWRVFGDEMRCF
jgi:hypothetical protein